MRYLRLSRPAQADLDTIWQYTYERYGIEQAEAYDTLLWQALEDLETDPERPTTCLQPEIGPHVRSYHTALSKKRSGTRIGKPRHVIYFSLEFEGEVFIMRIIKDDMDADKHLSEE